MKNKQCIHCGESNLDKLVKGGNNTRRNICKKCHCNNNKIWYKSLSKEDKSKRSKEYYKKRKEKIKNFTEDEKIIEWAKRFRNRSIIGLKRKDNFNSRKDLSIDLLVEKAKEGLNKFPYMTFLDSKNKWATASVDRIDSSKEYSEDNIRVVPFWLNSAMLNLDDDKFHELITHYYINFIEQN